MSGAGGRTGFGGPGPTRPSSAAMVSRTPTPRSQRRHPAAVPEPAKSGHPDTLIAVLSRPLEATRCRALGRPSGPITLYGWGPWRDVGRRCPKPARPRNQPQVSRTPVEPTANVYEARPIQTLPTSLQHCLFLRGGGKRQTNERRKAVKGERRSGCLTRTLTLCAREHRGSVCQRINALDLRARRRPLRDTEE